MCKLRCVCVSVCLCACMCVFACVWICVCVCVCVWVDGCTLVRVCKCSCVFVCLLSSFSETELKEKIIFIPCFLTFRCWHFSFLVSLLHDDGSHVVLLPGERLRWKYQAYVNSRENTREYKWSLYHPPVVKMCPVDLSSCGCMFHLINKHQHLQRRRPQAIHD